MAEGGQMPDRRQTKRMAGGWTADGAWTADRRRTTDALWSLLFHLLFDVSERTSLMYTHMRQANGQMAF